MSDSESDGEEAELNQSAQQITTQHERVINKIEEDMLAAEIKISLFVCALESYRYDSVLRPFPPTGLREDVTKDVQKLVSVKI
jgi:poly[ADP-ribose] polymerase 16